MNTGIRRGRTGAVIGVICAAVVAGSAFGQADIEWAAPVGGTFQTGGNWDGGTAPGTDDRATFNQDGTYTVDFAGNATTRWLSVLDGVVTFDLGGDTYTAAGTTGEHHILSGLGTELSVLGGTVHLDSAWSSNPGFEILGGAALSVGAGASVQQGGAYFYLTDGSLSVTGGGEFVSKAGDAGSSISIGRGAVGNMAEILVAGTGSSFVVNQFQAASFGLDGATGRLRVEDGGKAEFYRHIYLGANADSFGEWTITGAGSSATIGLSTSTKALRIGSSGSGSILVENGGSFTVSTARNDDLLIGWGPGSEGSITSRGSGSTVSLGHARHIDVGRSGTGALAVEAGGYMHVGHLYLGRNSGGSGTVTVTGSGSELLVNDVRNFHIGMAGTGTVQVTAGGKLSAPETSIGQAAGGEGSVTVTGSGSEMVMHATRGIGVGGSAAGTEWVGAPGGVGTLSVVDGGHVNASTGRLYGFDGSTVRVGHGGRIDTDTLMLQGGSTLEVVLGAPNFGLAMITAQTEARLDGNTFRILVGADFEYEEGEWFQVLQFGSLHADFNRFDGIEEGDWVYAENALNYGFEISYDDEVPGSVLLTAVIPEPATVLLLLGGGVALALRRRRSAG